MEREGGEEEKDRLIYLTGVSRLTWQWWLGVEAVMMALAVEFVGLWSDDRTVEAAKTLRWIMTLMPPEAALVWGGAGAPGNRSGEGSCA